MASQLERRGNRTQSPGSFDEVPPIKDASPIRALSSKTPPRSEGTKGPPRSTTASVSPLPTIRRQTMPGASDAIKCQSGFESRDKGGWDLISRTDMDRRQLSRMQAKEDNRFLAHAQREVLTQREQIESLRADNARLRAQIAQRMDEQKAQVNDKNNDAVSALVGKKMEVERAIEQELEVLEALNEHVKHMSASIQRVLGAKREGLQRPGEREHFKAVQKKEERIHHYAQLHSEVIAGGRLLRTQIDDLRGEKRRLKRLIQARNVALEKRTVEMIQLINIANSFHAERTRCHLMRSDMISQAGSEMNAHRSEMQELQRELDLCDVVLRGHEQHQDQEHSCVAASDSELESTHAVGVREELGEEERLWHQNLIEVFDQLLQSKGFLDATDLVERFLAKEESLVIQERYLSALRADAKEMEQTIEGLITEAKQFLDHPSAEALEAARMKEELAVARRRAGDWEAAYLRALEVLNDVSTAAARLRAQSFNSQLLGSTRTAYRRWALVRISLGRIARMASVVPKTKELRSGENEDLRDRAAQGMYALSDLAVLEKHTLALLRAAAGLRLGMPVEREISTMLRHGSHEQSAESGEEWAGNVLAEKYADGHEGL